MNLYLPEGALRSEQIEAKLFGLLADGAFPKGVTGFDLIYDDSVMYVNSFSTHYLIIAVRVKYPFCEGIAVEEVIDQMDLPCRHRMSVRIFPNGASTGYLVKLPPGRCVYGLHHYTVASPIKVTTDSRTLTLLAELGISEYQFSVNEDARYIHVLTDHERILLEIAL